MFDPKVNFRVHLIPEPPGSRTPRHKAKNWGVASGEQRPLLFVCLTQDLSSWKQRRKSRTTYQHAQDLLDVENLNNEDSGRRRQKTFKEMIQNR